MVRVPVLWSGLLLLSLCAFIFFATAVGAAEPKSVLRVGVLPFRIYALNPEKDRGMVKEDGSLDFRGIGEG